MPDTLTFVGTATTLLRIGSFTVLTDPNFLHRGQRAYLGKGLWSKRLTEPAMTIGQLPALDAVVLSHLHGDHFDRVARRGLDRGVPLVTTPSAANRLRSYGFHTHALRTWEQWELTRAGETLTAESMPAVHARGIMGRLLPDVMGTLLTHRRAGQVTLRLYLSGDTLTGAHLDEIHRRHPEIDVAVAHLGGTRVLLHTVTMDAAQGVDFARRIDPDVIVPVHNDDYGVFRSPLHRFITAAQGTVRGRIDVVEPGQTVHLQPAGHHA